MNEPIHRTKYATMTLEELLSFIRLVGYIHQGDLFMEMFCRLENVKETEKERIDEAVPDAMDKYYDAQYD